MLNLCVDLIAIVDARTVTWTKEDEKNVKGQFARTKIGWCGVGRDQ